jgi:hypothetical protein
MFVSNYSPVRLPMALYSQCEINALAFLCLRVNRASIACAANAAPSVPNEFKRRAVTTRALRASQPTRTACSLAAACQCLRRALHLIDFHGHVIFSQEKNTHICVTSHRRPLARCVAGVAPFLGGRSITHLITESRLQTCLTSAATVCKLQPSPFLSRTESNHHSHQAQLCCCVVVWKLEHCTRRCRCRPASDV